MNITKEEKLVDEILNQQPVDLEEYPIVKSRLLELVRDVRKIRVDTLICCIDRWRLKNVRFHIIETKQDFVCVCMYRDKLIVDDEHTMIISKEFDLERMYYTVETLAKIKKISCAEMVKELAHRSEMNTWREKKITNEKNRE